MKERALCLLPLLFLLLLVAPALVAQNPNYNNGPVWRVIYIDVKPGMGDAFWTDIRQNFRPIYDEFKKQGWIVDYKPEPPLWDGYANQKVRARELGGCGACWHSRIPPTT